MAEINRSTIVDALDANLDSMHQDGLNKWNEEYSVCLNILNSDKQSEKDSHISGFKTMPQKAEGADVEFDRLYAGISKTYTHLTYALGYEITEEAIEDNLRTPDTFAKLPQALARSGIETVETSAFSIFNNGFTTNGFDGVPLFSESHPLLAGGTQANKPSTDADLSVSSLTAGLTTIEKYVDERGLKQPTKAKTLLVPVDLWNVAEELLGSDYKPYVANNETNALLTKNLQYYEGHYLTDTDSWFLLAQKDMHQLKFYWRVRPGALRRDADFNSTNLKHLQRMRFSYGYSHYMGTYGTSGA